MTRTKISHGDFAVATEQIKDVAQNSVGLVHSITKERAMIYFVGTAKLVDVPRDSIKLIDLDQTGKGFPVKICNVCHILKNTNHFDKNQTDVHGKSTTRPSCTDCRRNIDGVKLTAEETKRMEKIRPKRKSIFTCPICQKRTIVGITVRLVKDHDHKTGKGRAWICDSCNTGLGRFKDDVKFFERIIDYLNQFA